MSDTDDSELDELFSFSTGNQAESRDLTSSPINFDVDDDDFGSALMSGKTDSSTQHSPSASGSGVVLGEVESDEKNKEAAQTAVPHLGSGISSNSSSSDIGSGNSGIKMERKSSLSDGDDSFLDVFDEASLGNENEKNNSKSETQIKEEIQDFLKDDFNAKDAHIDEPKASTLAQEDDFHQHDAGTRDFLEWLDKDGNTNQNSTEENQTKDDIDVDIDIEISDPTDLNHQQDQNEADGANKDKIDDVAAPAQTKNDSFDFAKDILGESDQSHVVTDPIPDPVLTETSSNLNKTKPDNNSPTNEISDPNAVTLSINSEEQSKKIDDTEENTGTEVTPTLISETSKDSNEILNTSELQPLPPLELKTFDSLSEALTSQDSTIDQIFNLFQEQKQNVDAADRPNLWLKLVCSKPMEYVNSSSVADSFREWKDRSFDTEFSDSHLNTTLDQESEHYVEYVAKALNTTSEENDSRQAASKLSLLSILLFYYKSLDTRLSSGRRQLASWDPLLFPIASTILSAGIPDVPASVMLAKIFPSAMPLMVLTGTDRFHAAKSLHIKFYLLACYHLPLLVLHLDRYAPGWYWPKKPKMNSRILAQDDDNQYDNHDDSVNEGDVNATEKGRNLDSYGAIPMSWFLTLFADEDSIPNTGILLRLWDILLTSRDNSLKFFLVLSILEEYSDSLLMLRGTEVETKIHDIMSFKNFTSPKSDEISSNPLLFVQNWFKKAKILSDSTPSSVSTELCKAEDEALTENLLKRQEITNERLRVRLSAEAALYRKNKENEVKRQQEATRRAVVETQLTAFYQKHNPEKLDTIDLVLEQFKGRYDQLDEELRKKYGHGYRLKIATKTNKLLTTMNEGLNAKKMSTKLQVEAFNKRFITPLNSNDDSWPKHNSNEKTHQHHVAVKVGPEDILPNICASRASKLQEHQNEDIFPDDLDAHINFYLIDSRPEEAAKAQGRFPTAISISPEALLEPDLVQKELDVFESLRGTVHICVMGEGYGSLPELYNQDLNPQEAALSAEDQSRTDRCALFFIKKGFPFVSILKGGFAGAHAWLAREGPYEELSSVLVDYDEKFSQLARLETAYKELQSNGVSNAQYKATRAIQNFLENSMTSLTLSANRIDEFAADEENRQKLKESVNSFLSKVKRASVEMEEDETGNEESDTENEESKKTSDEGNWKKIVAKVNAIGKTKVTVDAIEEDTVEIMDSRDTEEQVGKNRIPFKVSNPFSKKVSLQFGTKKDDESNEVDEDAHKMQKTKGLFSFKQTFAKEKNPLISNDEIFNEGESKDIEHKRLNDNKTSGFELKNPFLKKKSPQTELNPPTIATGDNNSHELGLKNSFAKMKSKAAFSLLKGRNLDHNLPESELVDKSLTDSKPPTVSASFSMMKKPFLGFKGESVKENVANKKNTNSVLNPFKNKILFGDKTFSESEESIAFDDKTEDDQRENSKGASNMEETSEQLFPADTIPTDGEVIDFSEAGDSAKEGVSS